MLAALPRGVPAPALVGFASVDGWSVLVLEVVEGRMPGQPWTPDEVEAVHRACLVMAEVGTPCTVGDPALGRALSTDTEILAVARTFADGSFVGGPELPRWLPRYQARVAELVLGAEGRFDGDTLCHGDLRPDNLLVSVGEPAVATVVDWNWVGRGRRVGGLGRAAPAHGGARGRHGGAVDVVAAHPRCRTRTRWTPTWRPSPRTCSAGTATRRRRGAHPR